MENLQSMPEVQKIISLGKANGEVSYDDINEILPDKILNSEKIDDFFTLLHEMGIEIVEEYTRNTLEPASTLVPKDDSKPARKKKESSASTSGSEDPIKLYLREIGKVSLISGETEVFLAKRIEKGEKIIEETILSSSILRANYIKLLPKIRSKKIKVYDLIRVDKMYALNAEEAHKLEELFFKNILVIQEQA